MGLARTPLLIKKTFETATGLINLNKWHHIAVVFKSANEATIYVDGFAKPTTVFGSASNCYYYRVVGTAGKIGGFVKGTGNRTLDGMVDKVKFFGTALTQSEIFALSYVKHNNMSSLLFNYNMNNNYNDTSIYQQTTDLATTSCQYGPDKLLYTNAVLNVSPTSAIEIREAAGNFKCNFPMTFSSWIKLNSLGSINPIFTNDDNLGTYTGVWIQILANGTIGVNIGDGVSVGPFSRRSYVTTNALSVDSQWRHLAVVLKSAPSPALYTTEIYVDGVLWPVGAQSGSGGQLAYYTGNGNWARIGCYYKGGNVLSTLSGSMDGVMFWNDSLTSDEINNIVDNYYTGCLTLPTIEAIASVDTICYGTTVTLNGSGGNTYTWSGGITDGVAFLPSATTTYIVNGTDVNSCTNTDSISITVNQLPAITVNVSSDSVCKGTSVTLQGAGANSYVWSGNINDNVSFVPTATTTYTLIATDVNMCSDTVTTTIVVNNLPDTTISLSGNIITATTIAEALYQWVDCGNGYTPIPSETNQSFTATVNGSYAVIVTSNGCSDTSSCVSVSSVAVSENENSLFSFYPNPTNGIIQFRNQQNQGSILLIENYNGQLINSIYLNANDKQIDLSFLADGMYFMKLKNDSSVLTHKLVIAK